MHCTTCGCENPDGAKFCNGGSASLLGLRLQSTGDGIFAFFGAPIAHEDHPQRALYAALRMQEESKRFAETLRREKGINFQIRVGLNTGEMVLRSIRKDDLRTEYTPVGHSTSLASRMESLAAPGSTVASENTYGADGPTDPQATHLRGDQAAAGA